MAWSKSQVESDDGGWRVEGKAARVTLRRHYWKGEGNVYADYSDESGRIYDHVQLNVFDSEKSPLSF